jgi:hypothetical protein
MKNEQLKEKILEIVKLNVSENDMMDYTEMDLEVLVRRISQNINKPVAIWVDEISDGKYKINIRDNGKEKSADMVAWDSREQFAESVYFLFE